MHIVFRFRGECMSCSAQDPFSGEGERLESVKCSSCKRVFSREVLNPSLLTRHLIPTMLAVGDNSVRLLQPEGSEILFRLQILRVLNASLMASFNLEPAGSAEGGIKGLVEPVVADGAEMVELRNTSPELGLEDEIRLAENPGCTEVLVAYETLLRGLFLDELLVRGDFSLRPGAILQLSDPAHAEYADRIMGHMIRGRFGGMHMTAMLQRFAGLKHPCGDALQGMSRRAVIQSFVPEGLEDAMVAVEA